MTYPRFIHKTKLRGKYTGSVRTVIIEDHGKSGYMAQCTIGQEHDVNDLRSSTDVLDIFPTLTEACDAVSWPYDIVGFPVLK